MDQFGVLVESIGFKSQGKSAPLADLKGKNSIYNGYPRNSGFNNKPSSNSFNGSFVDDLDGVFRSNNNRNSQNSNGFDDIFGGSNMYDLDSVFKGSSNTGTKSSTTGFYDNGDNIFGGLSGSKNSASMNYDNVFGNMASPPKHSDSVDDLLGNFAEMGFKRNTMRGDSKKKVNNASEFDDLIPGFGGSSPSSNGAKSETSESPQSSGHSAKSNKTLVEDPFKIFESSSPQINNTSTLIPDPLDQYARKSSAWSSVDELEDFATGRVRNEANEQSGIRFGEKLGKDRAEEKFRYAKEVRVKKNMEGSRVTQKPKGETTTHDAHKRDFKANHERAHRENKETEKERVQKRVGEERRSSEMENDLESFFSVGSQPRHAPSQGSSTEDSLFDTLFQKRESTPVQRTSSGTSSNTKKTSSVPNIDDNFSFLFGFEAAPSLGQFQEVEGETEERRRARLNQHIRTQERMAKALNEKNQRDLQTQREQEERHRVAETLDDNIKRWAAGKEGNLRALLSSMQHVLWPESGWQPVSLTDLITSTSVKKVYHKATLCVHPDKVQQKGASIQQKYIAEKLFDLLKEAWNKFNSEEL